MTSYVIDSYAWIEYLDGTDRGARVARILEGRLERYTPTPVVAEVTSKALRTGRDAGVAWAAMKTLSIVLPLDAEAARSTGALHATYRKRISDFSLTDAVLLAFARRLDARILTGDPHFQGMRGIDFIT
ncbi:MAG: PIN domain-containing protein [Methanobacteriota archaeon]